MLQQALTRHNSRAMSPAILVCRGVDCAGLGSAATLVEIEELCAEVRSSCAGADVLSVGTTACTQQCTSSPNVHRGGDLHGRVDGPAECAAVVNAAAARLRLGATPAIARDGIMQKRAAGMRFRALKLLSRPDRASTREGAALLAAALDAEQRAAGADPAKVERARRRRARLLAPEAFSSLHR